MENSDHFKESTILKEVLTSSEDEDEPIVIETNVITLSATGCEAPIESGDTIPVLQVQLYNNDNSVV